MTTNVLDRSGLRREDDLHPDFTLIEAQRPTQETPRIRPTLSRARGFDSALHPDFAFDPEDFELSEAVVSSDHGPSLNGVGAADLIPLASVDLAAQDDGFGLAYANYDPDGGFIDEQEPVDFAFSPTDLDHDKHSLLSDFDWDDYSGESFERDKVQGSEPVELFDFDISDLEAGGEAAPAIDETLTARDQRLNAAAAELVLNLGAFAIAQRQALFGRIRAVLDDFPHHASHLALARLLKAGASLEDLEQAAQLRLLWLRQPWLWGQKRRSLGRWEVWRNPNQRLAFGWPTALRLVRTFGSVQAEQDLCDAWFQTWVELQRHRAANFEEEMAFFSFAEFLRQVSHPILLSESEGVLSEPADQEDRIEMRDAQGLPVWHFASDFSVQGAEQSVEKARNRAKNHRQFDTSACDNAAGLGALEAVGAVDYVAPNYLRKYRFPQQSCLLRAGDRVAVSTESAHGIGDVIALDVEEASVVLSVSCVYKRLLADTIALRGTAPDVEQRSAPPKPTKSKSKGS